MRASIRAHCRRDRRACGSREGEGRSARRSTVARDAARKRRAPAKKRTRATPVQARGRKPARAAAAGWRGVTRLPVLEQRHSTCSASRCVAAGVFLVLPAVRAAGTAGAAAQRARRRPALRWSACSAYGAPGRAVAAVGALLRAAPGAARGAPVPRGRDLPVRRADAGARRRHARARARGRAARLLAHGLPSLRAAAASSARRCSTARRTLIGRRRRAHPRVFLFVAGAAAAHRRVDRGRAPRDRPRSPPTPRARCAAPRPSCAAAEAHAARRARCRPSSCRREPDDAEPIVHATHVEARGSPDRSSTSPSPSRRRRRRASRDDDGRRPSRRQPAPSCPQPRRGPRPRTSTGALPEPAGAQALDRRADASPTPPARSGSPPQLVEALGHFGVEAKVVGDRRRPAHHPLRAAARARDQDVARSPSSRTTSPTRWPRPTSASSRRSPASRPSASRSPTQHRRIVRLGDVFQDAAEGLVAADRLAGQGRRRQGDRRRPGEDAAPARRGHDRRRQVGRDQRDAQLGPAARDARTRCGSCSSTPSRSSSTTTSRSRTC